MKNEHEKALALELDALRTTRDDLKLKLDLATADVRDAFHHLEAKWSHLDKEVRQSVEQTKAAGQEMGDEVKGMVDDLKRAYADIRRTLTTDPR